MRVCDVVLNSVWYDPRVRKQIDEYAANNVDLYVVGLEDGKIDYDEIAAIPAKVNIIKLKPEYIGKLSSAVKKLKRERLYVKKIAEAIVETKADVIHANDLNALLPAYKAAVKLKCKLIYDSHEIFTENQDISSSKAKQLYWKYYEKKLMKKIDLFVCVSHAACDYFTNKYKIKNFLVVTNCCGKAKQSIERLEKTDKFEILNHGRFYGGRGYKTMLESAAITNEPDIEYVLRGYGELEKELYEYIGRNDLKNARIDPPVKVYEMIRQATRSNVGVAITEPTCLNFKLSVSNKIFEYVTAGLPVIMSDIPEHRYLNEKYNFGIVLKDNTPECLAEAVKTLYSDRVLYKKYQQNAQIMAGEINWENEFGKLIGYERRLVGEETC